MVRKSQRAKYYAIAVGRKQGIFQSWEFTKEQVNKYPGAIFQSFPTHEAASQWMQNYENQTTTATPNLNSTPSLDFQNECTEECLSIIEDDELYFHPRKLLFNDDDGNNCEIIHTDIHSDSEFSLNNGSNPSLSPPPSPCTEKNT